MLIKVKFTQNSLYGSKGEVRDVTEKAAFQFEKAGLAQKVGEKVEEVKEEKAIPETKEEKFIPETKEKKVKVTKAPRL